ncbi:MAG: hypothetical protein IAF00_05105, partial [Phycisphaerales bacterium]|nr:hypothetical protein [Phycisphaerales bacterium]
MIGGRSGVVGCELGVVGCEREINLIGGRSDVFGCEREVSLTGGKSTGADGAGDFTCVEGATDGLVRTTGGFVDATVGWVGVGREGVIFTVRSVLVAAGSFAVGRDTDLAGGRRVSAGGGAVDAVGAVDAGALVAGFATRESGVDAVGACSTRSLGVGAVLGVLRVAFAVLADLERFEETAFGVVVDARWAGVVTTGNGPDSSCGAVGAVGVTATGGSSGAGDSSGSSDCLDSVASDPASVVAGSLPVSGSGSGAISGGAALSVTEVVSSAGGSGVAGTGVGSGLSVVEAVEAVDASGCASGAAGATGLEAVRVLIISGVRTSCGWVGLDGARKSVQASALANPSTPT